MGTGLTMADTVATLTRLGHRGADRGIFTPRAAVPQQSQRQ